MKVIIVGAGIAGLSLAISLTRHSHQVVLVESAPQLAELGAGIQLTPQAIKYLFKWGLKDDLLAESIVPDCMYIRHFQDGRLLGTIPVDQMAARYGAPYIVVHRAVLHSILHKHAANGGAEIRTDARVVTYDFAAGAVELHTGERLEADIVVAADGINSFARQQLLGASDPGSRPTGWAAFRMSAEMGRVRDDPLLARVTGLESGSSNFWIAPHRSCMTYLVKGGTMLNIVLSHRDDVDTRGFSREQYKQTVDEQFRSFDTPGGPSVRRLLDLSGEKISNYPVYEVPPLPKWVHSSGRFTLMGDAAHAMAFYMSMGVSLAVEDATALATALNYVEAKANSMTHGSAPTLASCEGKEILRKVMHEFQKVRKRRVLAVQRASLYAGDTLHVEDGDKRVALYEALRQSDRAFLQPPMDPNQVVEHTIQIVPGGPERCGLGGISDKATRDWCYDFDADGDALSAIEMVDI
ncbi:FAD-dependent oxidoreductase [Metarhizium robertsii]|uniref:Salicylate hydroxylase n=2 Tax=Metarhizium robertsii TaxID=568076 RepID=E9FCU7_METRA|nr:salicylate hydroxylase [Metarhizium robertsii ARSEF 23]EFY94419.1 salicylate hydroxylase [Metarhizium robertsii ARSEF 23]EXU95882.1 FAD-dependent oxidoreductase [Metarhizium robertsii]